MAGTSSMQTAHAFISFYQNWLKEHESLLQDLESLLSPIDGFDRNKECIEMIPRVSSHYQEFYHEKSKALDEYLFLFLSPPWLTSFERSLLWISGFKPSTLFTLLDRSVSPEELSDEQKGRIEAARGETRKQERKITQAMARVQETAAEPPFYDLARKLGKPSLDSDKVELEAATKELKAAMLVVVSEADALRQSTAGVILEVLSPLQSVRFFAAAVRFQLGARKYGLERDFERKLNSGDVLEA